MNEITCQVCMDLIPLVQDGVASEDSVAAVQQHIAHCESCRALYGGTVPPAADSTAIFRKLQHKVQLLCTLLMMFAIFFGLGLTAGSGVFYNCLIMPVIGALGYLIFQWRAFYNVPVLLLIIHAVTNGMNLFRGVEHLDPLSLLWWTVIYCIFAAIGILIAGLLHFALRTEKGEINMEQKKRRNLKRLALLAALVLLAGLLFFANSLLGNPVSKALAQKGAEEYIAAAYPGTDYQVDHVGYAFKVPGYFARISSPSSIDTHFDLDLDMWGHVLHDSYDSYVPTRWNTWNRLEIQYRDLVDTALESPDFPYAQHIGFGTLVTSGNEPHLMRPVPGLDTSTLVPDQEYDIRELGRQYGQLVLSLEDDVVSHERAAEMLLDVRRRMDEADIPFASVDFELLHPWPDREGAPRPEGSVDLELILYEELTEDGLLQRIADIEQDTAAYWAALDEENAKEVPQAIETE